MFQTIKNLTQILDAVMAVGRGIKSQLSKANIWERAALTSRANFFSFPSSCNDSLLRHASCCLFCYRANRCN